MKFYFLLSGVLLQCCMYSSRQDEFRAYIHHHKPQEISHDIIITLNDVIDKSYVCQFLEPEYDSDRFSYAYGVVDTLFNNIIVTTSMRFNDNDAVVDPEIDTPKEIDPEFGLSEYVITTYDMLGNFISQIRVGKWLDGYSPSYVSKYSIEGNKILDLTVGPFSVLPEETNEMSREFSIEPDGQIRQIGVTQTRNILFTEKDLIPFLKR